MTPAGLEPLPGWVDSLNGPMGVLVAASKGVLRIMHCTGENSSHVVPVDMAISATIIVAWKLGSAEKQLVFLYGSGKFYSIYNTKLRIFDKLFLYQLSSAIQ